MSLRFSLRWILAAIGIFAGLLYFCVVRPTMRATRIVAAVERSDIAALDEALGNKDWRAARNSSLTKDRSTRVDHIYAELFPRNWRDWLGGRRRIVLRIACHRDADGGHVEWTEDIDLVSRATGVRISAPDAEF